MSTFENGRGSILRVFALTIVFVIFGVSDFRWPVSRKQIDHVSPEAQNYIYYEPLHGSEGGKTLARACGNCHSNQTKLPWYGHVAPISWWIKGHVGEGKQALNFTERTTYSAHRRRDELKSICGVVSNGRMPPASYTVLHPESRLEAQDKKAICAWAISESGHEE